AEPGWIRCDLPGCKSRIRCKPCSRTDEFDPFWLERGRDANSKTQAHPVAALRQSRQSRNRVARSVWSAPVFQRFRFVRRAWRQPKRRNTPHSERLTPESGTSPFLTKGCDALAKV